MSFSSVSTKQRLGRQCSVSVSCQKKDSFAKKAAVTAGTVLVTVGLCASSTMAKVSVYDDTHTYLAELNQKTRLYEIVKGPAQDEYQAKLEKMQDEQFGKYKKDAQTEGTPLKKLLDESKANEEFFDRLRQVKSYANYARAQQGGEGFLECSFPNNFLGCDGKFAKDKWIKMARDMEKKAEEIGEGRKGATIDFARYTNSYPK